MTSNKPPAQQKAHTTLSHQLPYPVFGVEWARHRTLVVAGGGGSSRTGVPNAVTVYRVRFWSVEIECPHAHVRTHVWSDVMYSGCLHTFTQHTHCTKNKTHSSRAGPSPR